MYTILVNLKSEEDAADLAAKLSAEIQPEGVRTELFVWQPSDSPTVIDAYTFEKSTAELAHAYLMELATEHPAARAA